MNVMDRSVVIAYGEKLNADLLIATDSDANRLAVVVKNAEGICDLMPSK